MEWGKGQNEEGEEPEGFVRKRKKEREREGFLDLLIGRVEVA